MAKEQIRTGGAAAPGGAYSQGIRAGDFVYVSGQGPIDPTTGTVVGETIEEQTERTLRYARDVGVDFAKFAITVPFPGSGLYEEMKEAGRLDRTDWENFTTFNPDPDRLVLATMSQSGRALLRLQQRGTMQFYLRPQTIARQLLQIRTVSARNIAYGLYALLG